MDDVIFGLPQSSREVFSILEENKILPKKLADNMKVMVGFRNIAIHDYTKINIDILESVLKNDLQYFKELNQYMLNLKES